MSTRNTHKIFRLSISDFFSRILETLLFTCVKRFVPTGSFFHSEVGVEGSAEEEQEAAPEMSQLGGEVETVHLPTSLKRNSLKESLDLGENLLVLRVELSC